MMMLAPILAGSATATGAAGVVSSGFSLAKLLSGGFSVVSGLASIAKGNAEAASLEDQALWSEFNASRELTRGKEEAVNALKAGNDAIAAAQVAGFASGLQSSGSVTQAKMDAARDATFNADNARDSAFIAAGARRGEAARLRSDASAERRGGIFGAFTTIGGAFGRFASTG